MSNIDGFLREDLKKYILNGREVAYPFPIEDFALVVFGLDIQYGDFSELFKSSLINTNEIYGCLYPDGHYFYGQDKVVVINTNREPFIIGDMVVPKELYWDTSERQVIAHEVGHYSDTSKTPSLFTYKMFESAPSILLHDPENEVFANKYARRLLMPEQEVKSFKARKEILGPVDIISQGIYFKEYFGVTQFMLEVRLRELNIPFINGFYMNRNQRSSGRTYSEDDLITLTNLAFNYGMSPNYSDCERISILFNKMREQDRDAGSLYMTIWRINNGFYDKFESVLELRMKLYAKMINSQKDKK